MKIIKSNGSNFKEPTIVTIGTFDGVHVGHQKIIKRLLQTATLENLRSVVLTFFPHPRMVLQKDANIKLINTIEERANILEKLGLEYLYIQEFTQVFSRLTAEAFVSDILVKQLNAKKIIIGYDHRFGRNRTADITDLRRFGEDYGFDVEEIMMQDIDEVAISSTKIRAALETGNIADANTYLGYPFFFTGIVVKGKGLGRQLGFSTANIQIKETYKIIPKQGVYVVQSTINDKLVYGMMNIGVNPTIGFNNPETIEVNFFDFNDMLYNKTITIQILKRLRDELKFETLDALKKAMQNDKKESLQFLTQELDIKNI